MLRLVSVSSRTVASALVLILVPVSGASALMPDVLDVSDALHAHTGTDDPDERRGHAFRHAVDALPAIPGGAPDARVAAERVHEGADGVTPRVPATLPGGGAALAGSGPDVVYRLIAWEDVAHVDARSSSPRHAGLPAAYALTPPTRAPAAFALDVDAIADTHAQTAPRAAAAPDAVPLHDGGPAPGPDAPARTASATGGVHAASAAPGVRAPESVPPAAAGLALAAPAVLGWALHHRVQGRAHLDHATRRRIYGLVCARPGLSVADLARAAGVSYSTATYHLDRLARAELLIAEGRRPRIRYYQNGGTLNESERRLHELLENPGAMSVLDAIRARPGTYRAALADALGVTPTTVNWHLKPLVTAGFVREERAGRSATLYVDATRVRGALAPLAEKLDGVPAGAMAQQILQKMA